ncbi:MAG: ERF family protein [Candidatus Riflebacteria bacterium]|nr:ERF family protein [Candidatus Riflebacteria bacterium]
METSKEIGKISEALSKVQGQLKPASYDLSNPHYKSKYASLASIMETCRPALSANGIAVIQGTSIDLETLRVNVTTLLTHVSGEWIKETLSIKPAMDSAQAIGSAISYGRRYCLSALVGIVSDDDDDGNLASGRPDVKPVLTTVKKTPVPTTATNAVAATANAPAATKTPVTNAVVPKTTTQATPVKTEAAVAPAKTEPVQPPSAQPEPTVTVAPKVETPTQQRIGKIREIFTLSAKLGHTPQDMKTEIAAILGWSAPLRESSQMTNDDLDKVLAVFNDALTAKSDLQQEAA